MTGLNNCRFTMFAIHRLVLCRPADLPLSYCYKSLDGDTRTTVGVGHNDVISKSIFCGAKIILNLDLL